MAHMSDSQPSNKNSDDSLSRLPSAPTLPGQSSTLLFGQQIHQLFSLAPYGILAALINGGILGGLFWTIVPQNFVASWILGLLLVNGLWALLLYRYRQDPPHIQNLKEWANWFMAGNFASGCIWGIGGMVLYPSASIGHEIFLAFVLGGMIAGATALYASYFPAFLAYALPTATPIILQFYLRADTLHLGMGIMGLLFIVIMVMTARRNQSMIVESLTLHHENSKLITSLTHARDQAEMLNGSLSKEVAHRAKIEEELRRNQEELKTLVEARTAALQSSESRYEFVTEHISDVIWMMELDGSQFSYVSPSIHELRGYSVEEAGRMSLEESLTPSSFEQAQLAMRQELSRLAKEPGKPGQPLLLELEHRRKDGSTVWTEVRARLLLDAKGYPLGFAGVTRDITERRKIAHEKRQLEVQLLRAQKMDAIGTLAGGIAHDFNNFLTSILGNITLTQHIAKLPSLGETYLTQAEQATMRAKGLTQQLLTFAKGGDPIKHLISLKDLIIESSGFALSGSSVICERHLATNLWPCEVDPGQVSQVIHNVVINAIQAMPNGGKLVIEADNIVIDQFHTASSLPLPPGPYAKITLSDEGVGIEKTQLDKIFEPYFSTKTDGQGLGLASSYAVMKKHGGHICVESRVNVGTQFSLYFPACASGDKPLKLEALPLRHGRGKILLMDDEEAIRLIAKEMLAHCGYQCVLAKDGYETIALYQNALDQNVPFSAVILDLTIPGGLGGKDTVLSLQEINPNILAFVSSGYSNDPIMANYQSYGFQGVITKPYSLIALSTILYQHLHLPASTPQTPEPPLHPSEPSKCSVSDTQ